MVSEQPSSGKRRVAKMTLTTEADGSELSRYAAEWRSNAQAQFSTIQQQFADQTRINQQIATTLADVTGAVKDLKDDITDIRAAMQKRPEAIRGNISVTGMIVFGIISMTCSGAGILIGAVEFLAAHWHP